MAGGCLPNFKDCDNVQANGCEANLQTDKNNCGGCGNVCSANNIAAVSCSQGVCNGACNAGFADCNANKLTDGHGVMLMLPNREVWTFSAHEDRVEVEESVYLSGPDGPRRTVQIVIYGRARKVLRVHWSFAHVTPAGAGAPRRREDDPELPL